MNPAKKLSIALSLFFFGLFIFSAQASNFDKAINIEVDQNLDEDEVIVYASALFYGKKARLRLGETSAAALKSHGIPVIRSIKIPKKTKVVIHFDEKADKTLYSTKDRIDTWGLSSVTVARFGERINTNQDRRTVSNTEEGKIELFQLSRFGGKKVSAKPGTYYPSSFKKYGIYTIRSVEIPKGMKIVAYFEDGTKNTFYNTKEKLSIGDFRKIEIVQFSSSSSSNNNTADNSNQRTTTSTNSSNSNGEKINLFQLSRFGGKRASLRPGIYSTKTIKRYGIYTIRSAEIPKGMKIIAHFENGTKKSFYNTDDKLDIDDFRKIEIVQFGN